MDEVIGRLAAEDHLSFHVIAKSEGLRKAFKADGHDLPQYKIQSDFLLQDKVKERQLQCPKSRFLHHEADVGFYA